MQVPPIRHAFMLITAALLLAAALWGARALPSPPLSITEEVGEATVRFSVSTTRRYSPLDCVTFAWESSAIETIAFDNEATVGEGERQFCEGRGGAELYVTFPDAGFREYQLPLTTTTTTTPFRLVAALAWVLGVTGLGVFVWNLGARLRGTPNPSVLLGSGSLLVAGLVAYVLLPAPFVYTDDNISLAVADTRHLWVNACYDVRWSATDISELYLNGQGQVGEGESRYCPGVLDPPSLRVVFPDGREQTVDAVGTYAAFSPLYWLAGSTALLLLSGGLYLLAGRWIDRLLSPAARVLEGLTVAAPFAFMTVALGAMQVFGTVSLETASIILAITYPLATIAWGWSRRDALGPVGHADDTSADRWRRFGAVAPLVLLLPMFVVRLLMPSAQTGGDAIVHSTIAYGISGGGIPADNAYMVGQPLSFYWMYNMTIGAVGLLFDRPPTYGAAVLHTLMAVGVLYWTARLVRYLLASARTTIRDGLAVILILFGMTLLGSYFLFERTTLFTVARVFPFMTYPPNLLAGHTAFLLNNTQGYTAVFPLVMAGLSAVAVIIRQGMNLRELALGAMAIVTITAFHAQSGLIIVLMLIGGALALAVGANVRVGSPSDLLDGIGKLWDTIVKHWQGALLIIAVAAIGGLLVASYVLGAADTDQGGIVGLTSEMAVLGWWALPLLPWFMIGAYQALANRDALVGFLAGAALMGFASGLTVSLGGLQLEKFLVYGGVAYNAVA
ncbi:MAG: hypothetical protein AAF125_07505, partial [Chloroflexota bacterium]